MRSSLIFGKIKYVKDEIVTSTGFTNATPQRKVLFIDRVTGYSNGFEGVITKVMYNQSINSTSINTCVMQSTIETRVVKVGDFVIIKEEYILYKGNPFEHVSGGFYRYHRYMRYDLYIGCSIRNNFH